MRHERQARFAYLSSRLTLACLMSWLVFGCPRPALAQEGALGSRGFHPTNSYAFSDIENINTATGNLLLQIPIASLPGGRNGHTAGVSLIYNSRTWDTWIERVNGWDPWVNPRSYTLNHLFAGPESGWRYGFEYSLQLSDRISFYSLEDRPMCPQQPEAEYIFRLRVRFPDGSLHEFRPNGFNDLMDDGYYQISPDGWMATCDGVAAPPYGGGYARMSPHGSPYGMTYYSIDGTYVRLDVQRDGDTNWSNNPWTLSFPDGRRVTGGNAPQRIYDRNDNFIEIRNITHNSHPATKLVDQLDRSVIIEYDDATSQDYIYSRGFNDVELKWTVKWKTVWPYKKYNPTDDGYLYTGHEYLYEGLRVVDQIITPPQDGARTYTFGYNATSSPPMDGDYSDGWGELSSVTLPTGARADYDYMLDGINDEVWRTALQNSPTRKEVTYQREYDNQSTPVTEAWTYELGPYGPRRVITPDGGVFREVIDVGYNGDTWRDGLSIETNRPDGSKIERIWRVNTPRGLDRTNPYVKTEFTSITDGAGNFVKTAIVDYTRDKNGNLLREATYNWIDYQSVPRDTSGRPTAIPYGLVPERVEVMTYHVEVPLAEDTYSESSLVYHKAGAPRLRNATRWSQVLDGAGAVRAHTEFTFDDPYGTGNLTVERSWDSTKGPHTDPLSAANSVSNSKEYDGVYGNILLSTDAGGRQTRYIYDPVNGFAGLYPTEVKTAPGTSFERTALRQYDFSTGLMTRDTDVNNDVATSYGYDVFGRDTLVAHAAGRPQEARSVTTYEDAARRVVTRSDLDAPGDGKLVTVQHFDQLGRLRLRRQLEDASNQTAEDETAGIKVQMRYQTSGSLNYQLTSNPYRAATSAAAAAEASMGWTRSAADSSGRPAEVRYFSGAGLPAPWGVNAVTTGADTYAYTGNSTVVTDADNNVRRSISDALGRLVRVDEPDAVSNDLGPVDNPAQKTVYTYDVLSNLIKVEQGEQTRQFVFSSLSRLVSASHPESGVTGYEYDDGGSIKTRVDARNVKTTFGYDGIGRLKSKVYDVSQAVPAGSVPATPTVNYGYDGEGVTGGVPFSVGRLTSVSTSVSASYVDEFDARGRVKRRRQVTGGQTYPMSYAYDTAGNCRSEVYPSGRVVTTDYDGAGRISGLTGDKPGEPSRSYLAAFQYAPFGAIAAVRRGNNLWEHATYNPRLQPAGIGLGTSPTDSGVFGLALSYGAGNNNGNVRTQTLTAPGVALTQTYLYDRLNRLKSAEEVGAGGAVWKQTFTHDLYGNRRIDPANTSPALVGDNPTISTANNRLNQAGHDYDFAGNIKQDVRNTVTNSYKFDAENRLVDFNDGQGSYAYDGEDQRVRKVEGATYPLTSVYVYNVDRELVAEHSSAPPTGSGTSYITVDHLGTPRVVTGAGGVVKARHDYLPYGEEIFGLGNRTTDNGYAGDHLRQQFTAKERDRESRLDFFLARYYSSGQGRFISPDFYGGDPEGLPSEVNSSRAMPYAALSNPQTLNSYAYVTNNPTTLVDADGHQGGIWESIPGAKSFYSMRIDNQNPNDAVNVHVEGRRGKPLGKIKVFGDGSHEADPRIPSKVVQKVLDALRNRGIQGRTPSFGNNPGVGTTGTQGANAGQGAAGQGGAAKGGKGGARGPRGGGGGGGKGASNAFAVLALLSMILDAMVQARDADEFGYYFDYMGKVVVTDMSKFVQNWNPATLLSFKGIVFKLINGKLISVSSECDGCELKQDPNGELYIQGPMARTKPVLRKPHEEVDFFYSLRRFATGG